MTSILNTYNISNKQLKRTDHIIDYLYSHININNLSVDDATFKLDETCKYLLHTNENTMLFADIYERVNKNALVNINDEFYNQFYISDRLANLLDLPTDILITPYTVINRLYHYFKDNNLLIIIDGIIHFKPDNNLCKLSLLFIEDKYEPFYKLQFYIAPHFRITKY